MIYYFNETTYFGMAGSNHDLGEQHGRGRGLLPERHRHRAGQALRQNHWNDS